MLSTKEKLRLSVALGVLAISALGISCRGFFQNPVLSSITVGPANPTIETGNTDNTVQMKVFGTNNDGSTTNSPAVAWSTSTGSVATVNTTGLVTAVSTGTSPITATPNQNPSISGTQTVTIVVGCIQSITVSPTSNTITVTGTPNTQLYDAKAATCNGVVDVTSTATWNSSNTAVATVAGGTATAVATGTTLITASITIPTGTITSNAATLNVTP